MFFQGGGSGGFTVTASGSTDDESGIAGYSYPALGAGWTNTGGDYSFDPSATDQTGSVTAQNNAGLTSTTTDFTAQADSSAPTSTITCNAATCSGWYTSSPVAIAITSGGETGASGIKRIVYTTDGTTPTINGSDTVTNGTEIDAATANFDITTDGTTTVKWIAEDNVGNISGVSSQTVQLDTSAPSAPTGFSFGATTHAYWPGSGSTVFFQGGGSGGFTVSATGSADGQSGIAGYSYPALGSGWSNTGGLYSFDGSAGTETGSVTAQNNAGLSSSGTGFTAQSDSSAPTSSITCNSAACSGWYTSSPVAIAIATGGETGASGIKRIVYTTDGSDPTIDGSDAVTNGTEVDAGSAGFDITADGTTTVKWIAEDNVGNTSGVSSQTVQLDTSAPSAPTGFAFSATTHAYYPGSGTVVYFQGAGTGGFTVAASGSADSESGIAGYTYPALGSGWTNTGGDYTFDATATTESGTVTAQNGAGLTGSGTDFTAQGDFNAPTSAISCNSAACSGWYTLSPVSVAISTGGESGASGVRRIVYTTDGSDPTINGSDTVTNGTEVAGANASLNITTDGTTTLKWIAEDNVGNTSGISSQTVQLDTSAPTPPSLAYSGFSHAYWPGSGSTVFFQGGGSGGFTVTASGSADDESGIAGYSYPALGAGWTNTGGDYSFDPSATDQTGSVTAQNNAGLTSTTTDFTAQADSSAPTSTITCNSATCSGWYTSSPVAITITSGGETGASGIKRIVYTTNGTTPTINGSDTVTNGTEADAATANFDITTDGTTTVKWIAEDNVGNISTLNSQTVQLDTTAPFVSSVSASNANGAYKAGQTIHVLVNFSEPVTVTGTPQLTLETGTTDEVVDYTAGSGTSTLTFDYTVQSGDTSADLDYTGTGALALNGGTIEDVATNDAVLTLATPGASGSLGASKNVVVDTTAPTVSGVTASNANGAYDAGSTIHIQVTFSEPVNVTGTPQLTLETGTTDETAGYSSGSGTSTLIFTYVVQPGDTSADLDYTATTALALNGGTIADPAANPATLTLAAPGAAGSLGASKNIVVDTTPPTVSGVTSSSSDGAYKAGQTIHVQVDFSEPVTVTGTPQLTLETGTTDEVVDYTSGTGTSTLTFDYTVQPGDTSADLDYVATTALALNGGTVADPAGNAATLTLAAPGAPGSLGANKNLVVDTTAPTVTNITSSPATLAYRAGQTVPITISFSEPVTVTGTPQLALANGATADYVSGSGGVDLTFDYTVAGGDTNTAHLAYAAADSLTLAGGTITDAATNDATLVLPAPGAAGSLDANTTIAIDTIAPTVSGVTATNSDGAYDAGSVIHVRVEFSEPVTVTGTPELTLETGSTDEVVDYVSGTGTSTLSFDYTVQPGDTSAHLDYHDTGALALNGGTIADPAGNDATLTLASPGAAGSLGASNSIVIDTTAPTVSSRTVDGSTLDVSYSEPLAAGSAPVGSDFAVSVNGGGDVVDGVAFAGGDTVVRLTLHDPVHFLDTVTVAYTGSAIQDPAGNQAATYTAQAVTNNTADAAPNTTTLNTPADAAFVDSTTPSLTATFTDPDTNDTGTITFQLCTASDCSAAGDPFSTFDSSAGIANGATGSASVPAGAGLASGSSYYWRAKAADSNSTQSASYSSIRSFTVDTGAPTSSYALVNVTTVTGLPVAYYPGSGTIIYYNGTAGSGAKSFTVEAAVSDAISGGASVTTQNFNGGLSNLTHTDGTTTTPGSGLFDTNTFDYTAPTSHDAAVDVYASDAAGNPSTTTSFTIHNDTVAPTASIGFPSTSVYNATSWTGTVTGTASDADAGVHAVMVAIHDNTTNTDYDGTSFGNGGQQYLTATGTTSWTYPLAATKLTDGDNYTITLETTDNVGNTDTAAASTTFTYDTTAPTVTNITASDANGAYSAGQTIHVQITFSEPVVVTGDPQLALNTTPAESATYASGSGTSTLVFDYVVQSGDNVATLDYTGTTALTSNSGTITDPAGNNATLTVATPGSAGSLAANKSLTIDTVHPTVNSVSASNANGSYKAGQTIHIQINLSEPVNVTGNPQLALNTSPAESATYGSGSGTSTLVFDYTVQAGDTAGPLDYAATTALTLNSGTIADPAGNPAILTLTPPGSAGSLADSKTITIDTTAPTVNSVSASDPDGSYRAGQTIHVQVNFSEPVTVGGSPQLALNTGESAVYASGSGSSTLVFDYTVQPGDTAADLDYTATGALTLNGGTIADPAGNNATLTLAAPGTAGSLGANKDIVVDTTAPTVSGVTASNADGSYTAGQTIHIQIDFSEPVDVTGNPELALNTSPAESAAYASGSGTSTLTFDYTIQAGDTAATLDYAASNALTLNGGTIRDAATNDATLTLATPGAAGSLSAGKSLTIDTTAPTVSNVTSSTVNGAYKAGQTIHILVNFDEPVTVTGTPQLLLETGTTDQTADYTSGSGSTTLVFDYTIQPGDTSADLDYHDAAALTLNGGTIRDAATNDATLTLATPGTAGSLSANDDLVVDTTAPTVTGVTASNANGSYKAGQTIHIQVNLSEPVTVSGTPQLALNTGETAAYASGSGSSTLIFDYTIQPGDTAATLDYAATNALTLNGATITDPAGNDADLTLATPGSAGSLADSKSITIDTTAPTVSGVTASNPNGSYNAGQTIHIRVNFSEPVTVTGNPQLALNTTPAESATYASGSGSSTLVFDYTVQPGDDAPTLDYAATNALTLNGGAITDPAGNNATLTLTTPGTAGSLAANKNITIDTSAPSVSSVSASNADGAYNAGQTIHIQVNFSVPVNVTGTPKLALNTTPAEQATYTSGSGTSTLTFDYTVQAGDNVATLDYAATTALTLNGGTIRDAATNDATLTLATPGTAGSLSDSKSIAIDTTDPTVNTVTSSDLNGAYKAGQTIHLQLVFAEPVNVTGTPQLLLETGTTDQTASYVSGSGSSTLVFDYTIQSGDTSADLDYHDTAALTLNGATITDPAGNNATLTLFTPGTAGSLSANKDLVVDTTAPTVTGVTASNTDGAYNAGQTIHIQVNFSEPVTVTGSPKLALNTTPAESAAYASGSGSSTLTFDYTIQAGDNAATLDYAATSSLTLNGGTIADPAGNDATLTLASPGAAGSLSNSKSLTIDTTAPAISGVTASNANGSYKAGQTIHVQVDFSEPVTVTGSPALALNTSPGESAAYASGSGSSILTFDYIAQSGDTSADLDYHDTAALTLNGGTIADPAANNATLTLATPGSAGSLAGNKNITIDTTAPTVSGVTASNANGSYKAGQTIHIQVNFSEPVDVTGNPQLALNTSPAESATYASGSGTSTLTFDYTVVAGDNAAALDYAATNALSLNSGTIADPAGNDATLTLATPGAAGSLSASKSLTIDTTAPTVSTVTASEPNGAYKAGQTIHLQVVFDEPVNVTGSPQLLLQTGSTDETASYASGSGSATLVFDYTVQPGDVSPDLDYHDTSALTLNGGTVADPAGNNATLTLFSPGAAGSLSANKDLVIDTTAPTVSGVTASNADGAYKAGQTIHIQVDFSEPVTVTGTPQLALNTAESAAYASGSGSSTLVFDYTVQSGDNVSTLDYAATNALSLSGGTVADPAGNSASLTLAVPGAAGSLSDSKSITIDTIAPTVTSRSVSGTTLDITYSEPLNAGSAPAGSDFIVTLNGSNDPVDAVSFAGGNTVVRLTLQNAVHFLDTITVAYGGTAVQDPAGNAAATYSAQAVTDNTSDAAPDTVTLNSPSDGAFVDSTTPTLTATFSDPDPNDTGTITFQLCTASDCSAAGDPFSTFDSPTGIANGSTGSASVPAGADLASGSGYYWRARATDSNSSQSASFSSIRSLTVDTGAPTNSYSLVNVTTVAGLPVAYYPGSGTTIYYNGSAGAGANSFTIEASVSDAISGGASVTTQNFNGGLSNLTHTDGTTTTPGSGLFDTNTFDYTAPTSHDAAVDVLSHDVAGNPSTTTSFLIHNDTVAPTASIGFPSTSVYDTAGWTGTLSGTSTDADAGVHAVLVAIHDDTAGSDYDGTSFGAGGQQYLTASGTSSWTYPLAAAKLSDGHSYTITVETIDDVGNTDTAAASQTFTYDTTPPTVTNVTASNANGAYNAGQTIHLQVTFTEPVNVTGSPQLALNTSPAESATYTSGTGTSTLAFDYTVQPGDNATTLDYTATTALTLNGGTITDPAGNAATLTLASPGSAGSLANSKSLTIDTTHPTVNSVTASNPNGAYNAGQTIHIQINFSEPVTVTGSPKLALNTTPAESATYASGSGTSTLTFDYTIQPGDTAATLDYATTTSLTLNGGTIADPAGNAATLTLATPGAAGSLSNGKSLTIDTTAPIASSVSASNPDGSYKAGQTIHVRVNFSEPVTVGGSPQLALNTGESAVYASGSGTSTLVFDYTVQPGDTSADLDYTATDALTLNGGTIADPAENNATLTLAAPGTAGSLGANKDIVVDTTAPTVSGVTASNADGAYTAGQTIHVQVTFSEPVVVTGSPHLALNTSPAESAVYASGGGTSTLTFDYTIQAGDTAATLDYAATSALTLNGGSIADVAGNDATLTLATPGSAGSLGANKSLTIDTTAPTVSNVTSSTVNGAYKAGQTIHVQVVFDEPVNVTGTPQLLLETGTTDETADYASGSGSATLVFDYTIQPGDTSADLDYHGTGALSLNGGTIADAAANDATLTLFTPGAAGSLSANDDLVVDTTAPTVTGVTSSNADGAYKAGQTIHVQVNFSEPVTVTGSPQLALNTTPGESAAYASGDGTSTLAFDYTVQAGDNAATLDYAATNALGLSGGTIRDAAANDATLTLAAPGAAGSLSANKSLTIDTTAPTVSGVTASNADGPYNAGQTIHVQIDFSEPVTVSGSPQLALNTNPGESAVYASGSGSSTLVFDYTVQPGDDAPTLDYTATNALTLNGGTIADPAGNDATLTLASPGGAGSLAANKSITIDTSAPSVSSVSASNADGAYKAGQTIHVQVNFSVPVNVTGSPQLALNTTPAEHATYASGGGSSTLVFDYTVVAGDNVAALDYAAANALSLNGGTIRNAATNDATLTLATPGAAGSLSDSKSIAIDTTDPTVNTVTASELNGAYKAGQTIHVQVVFDEPVNVTGTPQLALNTGESAAYASGSGTSTLVFDYTVQPGDTSADLDYQDTGALTLNGGTVADPAGNNAALTLFAPGAAGSLGANKDLVVDTTAPTVTGVTASNADGAYKAGQTIHIQVNFSEPVTVTGSPQGRPQHHAGRVGHLPVRHRHRHPHLRLHDPGRRQRRHPRLHRVQRAHSQRRHHRRPGGKRRNPHPRQPRRRRLAVEQQEHHGRHDRTDGQFAHGRRLDAGRHLQRAARRRLGAGRQRLRGQRQRQRRYGRRGRVCGRGHGGAADAPRAGALPRHRHRRLQRLRRRGSGRKPAASYSAQAVTDDTADAAPNTVTLNAPADGAFVDSTTPSLTATFTDPDPERHGHGRLRALQCRGLLGRRRSLLHVRARVRGSPTVPAAAPPCRPARACPAAAATTGGPRQPTATRRSRPLQQRSAASPSTPAHPPAATRSSNVTTVAGLPVAYYPGSGTTIYYNGSAGAGAKSFTVEAAVTDPISGGASVTTQNFNAGLSNLTHTDATTHHAGQRPLRHQHLHLHRPNKPRRQRGCLHTRRCREPQHHHQLPGPQRHRRPDGSVDFPSGSVYDASGWTGTLTGTAADADAGVNTVEVAIHDNTANSDYNGTSFGAGGQQYLTTTGTTSWTYPLAATKLTDGHYYTVTVETIDNVGNTDTAADKPDLHLRHHPAGGQRRHRLERRRRLRRRFDDSRPGQLHRAGGRHRQPAARPQHQPGRVGHLHLRQRHLHPRLRLHRPARRQRLARSTTRRRVAHPQQRHHHRPRRQRSHPDARRPRHHRIARRQQQPHHRHNRADRELGLGHQPRRRLQRRPDHPDPGRLLRARHRHRHPRARPQHHPRRVRRLRLRQRHLHPHLRLHHPAGRHRHTARLHHHQRPHPQQRHHHRPRRQQRNPHACQPRRGRLALG